LQIQWSRDDYTIVSASKDNFINIWNLQSGVIIYNLKLKDDNYALCMIHLTWDCDENTIIAGCKDNYLIILKGFDTDY
jgi:WD40 repeat protein